MTTESETKLARYKAVEREADEFGRIITVRRLRPSEQTKLNGMTGDLSGSDQITSKDTGQDFTLSHRIPLLIAASVCEIDQIVVPFPRNRGELDAIYDRLDMEGLAAAGRALTRLVANDVPVDAMDEAKNLFGDSTTRLILWLVRNGVPYDVAYAMEDWEMLAHAIIFSQFENGREWDWNRMRFVEKGE